MSEKEPLRPVWEGKSLNPDMHAAEESDWLIVPEKEANEAQAEEPLEGRGRTKEPSRTSSSGSVSGATFTADISGKAGRSETAAGHRGAGRQDNNDRDATRGGEKPRS